MTVVLPHVTRLRMLVVAALMLLPLPCVPQAPDPFAVAMRPLEAMGETDPEYATFLSSDLMRAIERRSDYRIVKGGPTRYLLKGQVLTDDKRHLVTLQLFETSTNRILWLENYDYRRTSADAMAEDVVDELYAASNFNAWE